MSETTKTCQVKMDDGEPCGRELYDDKRCIFHSKKEDKNLQLFQKGLDGILRVVSVETHDLTSFIFPQGVVFLKKFSKPATFWHAVFKGDADFNEITFENEADFFDAVFKGEADFQGADFKEGAAFWGVVFERTAHFSGTGIKGWTRFGQATFEGKAYFAGTAFENEADFSGALFKGSAYFRTATFEGEAIFIHALFKGEADFREAVFEDTLLINPLRHDKKTFEGEADFRWVKFSQPEKVEFQKVDLSQVRFLETDLRGVHFTDVEWEKEKGNNRNMVFDEVSLPLDPSPLDPYTSEVKKFDYALIAQLYRRLRANYEENLRYGEAGDFYIGEMEMTRKAQTSIFKKLPLLFYKAISNYGESYYRPLCWIAAILLIFPLLFMFAGIQPVSLDPSNPMEHVIRYKLDFSSTVSFLPTAEKIGDYYTCFLYSMSVFSFIRDKKYTTMNNWGRSLFVLESILSPVTLAFFLLALRRRFKR